MRFSPSAPPICHDGYLIFIENTVCHDYKMHTHRHKHTHTGFWMFEPWVNTRIQHTGWKMCRATMDVFQKLDTRLAIVQWFSSSDHSQHYSHKSIITNQLAQTSSTAAPVYNTWFTLGRKASTLIFRQLPLLCVVWAENGACFLSASLLSTNGVDYTRLRAVRTLTHLRVWSIFCVNRELDRK